jgi:phage-related tail fiber protein
MVHTRTFEDTILNISEGSVRHGHDQVPRDSAPPPPPRPPVILEQLLATQNDLMRRVVENDERCGAEREQPQHQERDSSYSDFLATHAVVFADGTDPLEADSWLHTKESKFGLLLCTEYQKTLYATQQLRGSTRAWWPSYITAVTSQNSYFRM